MTLLVTTTMSPSDNATVSDSERCEVVAGRDLRPLVRLDRRRGPESIIRAQRRGEVERRLCHGARGTPRPSCTAEWRATGSPSASRAVAAALSRSSTSQPSSRPPSDAGPVVAADRLGAHLDADHRQQFVGHAADRRATDDRRHARPRSRASCGARRRCPAPPRSCRPRRPGCSAGTTTEVGAVDRVEHAGRGRCLVDADRHDVVSRRRVQPHPVLLEVDGSAAALGRSGRR